MLDFCTFLFSKCWCFNSDHLNKVFVDKALALSFTDISYHFDIEKKAAQKRIEVNYAELAVFLYRLGNLVFKESSKHPLLSSIHWVMREVCSCEFFFSTEIGEGFHITHGLGTVIGSRNRIGKGFRIYQGCTIGHKEDAGRGAIIGNNVTMYANSLILGELTIGDNAVIGSNSLVLKDVPANSVAKGSPAVTSPRSKAEPK